MNVMAEMAEIEAKFSAPARARRDEIARQFRPLTVEVFELCIAETRRLCGEGKDYSQALASYCLVKQQLATADIRNPMAAGVMGLVMDASGNTDAMEHFSQQAQSRRHEILGQMTALAIEDMELSERELFRLGNETAGQAGMEYLEAASVVRTVLAQIGAPEWKTEEPGLLGDMLDATKGAVRSDILKWSRAN